MREPERDVSTDTETAQRPAHLQRASDGAAEGPAAGRERRRPGRQDDVNPTLIPLLRGAATPKDATAMPTRKGCAACREGTAIFPFSMAFQPIVDIVAGRIDAYEALVRGPSDEAAPHVLRQITKANVYSFDQACRVKAIELAARLGMDRQLSMNFLPNAVYDPRACIQTTLQAAARTGFPLDRLTFEILESETIADTNHLRNIIAEYRKHGFTIALDDFGTGYSGLARMAELKPDVVKLDRDLVAGCDKDRVRLAIVAGMLRIGADAGIKIVVEGVESAAEFQAVHDVGGRFFQGFFFARPAFEHLIRDHEIAWPDPMPA